MLRNPARCVCSRVLYRRDYVKPICVRNEKYVPTINKFFSNSFVSFHTESNQQEKNSNLFRYVFGHNAEFRFCQFKKLHKSSQTLAGHSQWANRKAGKEIQDKKKSDVRGLLLKSIMAVIKETGEPDPRFNSRLQKLFDQAKLKDVPKSVIDNLMKKIGSQSFEVTTVETVLPGNMYIIYEISSTTMPVTVNQIKTICKQVGGRLERGCCSHIFEEKGFIHVEVGPDEKVDIDKYVDVAIEAGAEDVVLEENDSERYLRFICEPEDLYQVKGKLEKSGLKVISFVNDFLPYELIELNESHKKILKTLQKKLDTNALTSCIEKRFINFIEEEE